MKGRAVAAGDVNAQTRNILEFIRHVPSRRWRHLERSCHALKICYKHAGSDREARALLDQILTVCRNHSGAAACAHRLWCGSAL